MWHDRCSPRVNREKAQQKRSQPPQTPAHPPAPEHCFHLTGLELSQVENKGGTSHVQYLGEATSGAPKLLAYTSYPARAHCTAVSPFRFPLFFFVHVFAPNCNSLAKSEWGFLMTTPKGTWLGSRPQVLLQVSSQHIQLIHSKSSVGVFFSYFFFFFNIGKNNMCSCPECLSPLAKVSPAFL